MLLLLLGAKFNAGKNDDFVAHTNDVNPFVSKYHELT